MVSPLIERQKKQIFAHLFFIRPNSFILLALLIRILENMHTSFVQHHKSSRRFEIYGEFNNKTQSAILEKVQDEFSTKIRGLCSFLSLSSERFSSFQWIPSKLLEEVETHENDT